MFLLFFLIFLKAEIEETIQRIKNHKQVEGIVICKKDGAIIRTTYTGENNRAKGEEIAKIIP